MMPSARGSPVQKYARIPRSASTNPSCVMTVSKSVVTIDLSFTPGSSAAAAVFSGSRLRLAWAWQGTMLQERIERKWTS